MAAVLYDADDLEFVQPLQDYFQLKCPICLDILLDDPHLVSCCGHHICGACLRNMGLLKPCPLCKSAKFQKVPDKGYQRALNSLQVYCLYKKDGCPWSGELKELGHHIAKEGTCAYVRFPCKHSCRESIIRSELHEHETSMCPLRPATCEHCLDYSATWEQVTIYHPVICPCFPMDCRNKCGESIKRNDMNDHVNNKCSHRRVECEFASVGCSWVGKQIEFTEHLEKSWRTHVSLVSHNSSQEIEKLKDCIEELNQRVDNLENEVFELKGAGNTSSNSDNSPPQASGVISNEDELDELEKRAAKKLAELALTDESEEEEETETIVMLSSQGLVVMPKPSTNEEPIYRFVVNRWHHKKAHNNLHYSQNFEIGAYPGYKMRLTVHCNGINCGYGTHVSVYSNIVDTPSKNHWLVWPFRETLIIKLIAQSLYANDRYCAIIYDDEVDDEYCLPDSKPYGIPEFISFGEINPYLRGSDDALEFEVYSID